MLVSRTVRCCAMLNIETPIIHKICRYPIILAIQELLIPDLVLAQMTFFRGFS